MSVDETLRKEVIELTTELHDGLLTMEAAPDETATAELFRATHTLKGTCAMGGLEEAATVAHALEELFEAVRGDAIEPTTPLVDVALDGVDAIAAVVDAPDIEAAVAPTQASTALQSQLAEQMDNDTPSTESATTPPDDPDDASHVSTETNDQMQPPDDDPFVWVSETPSTDIETLETELEAVSFGEFDDQDELSIQELLEIEPQTEPDEKTADGTEDEGDVTDDERSDDGSDKDETTTTDSDTIDASGDPFVWVTDDGPAVPDLEALEAELASVSFGEFDDEDVLSIQELLEIEPVDESDTDTSELESVELPASVEPQEQSSQAPPESFVPDPETEAFADRFGALFESDNGGDTRAVGTIEESSLELPTQSTPEKAVQSIHSVTVDVTTADDLLALAEKLSMVSLSLKEELDVDDDDELESLLTTLSSVETDVLQTVLKLRLLEFGDVVDRLPRLVRDIANAQEKRIDLEIDGNDVTFDRRIAERIREPLLHLVRNAADHGIESPATRKAAGKPPTGTIIVRAEQIRNGAIIEVEDDGAGIDPEAVLEAAVETGAIPATDVTDYDGTEAFDLLFHHGLSTAESVTDVSGRGVGMEIVDRVCTALDGSVEIESTPGSGTTVRLHVPITAAMAPLLFIAAGTERFAIPQSAVEGVARKRHSEDGHSPPYALSDGGDYRLCSLHERFDVSRTCETTSNIVWLRADIDRVGIECDRVIGTRQAVVTPYGPPLDSVRGISGATIEASGDVINVIDATTI
ncbi:chemotaxis protein CheA [Halocatena halophila]|uniref:chemotaxis protein CheA n=1 Tax=Halocatena halophila TaxID=2814576 RepID=UPI002ED14CC3